MGMTPRRHFFCYQHTYSKLHTHACTYHACNRLGKDKKHTPLL